MPSDREPQIKTLEQRKADVDRGLSELVKVLSMLSNDFHKFSERFNERSVQKTEEIVRKLNLAIIRGACVDFPVDSEGNYPKK